MGRKGTPRKASQAAPSVAKIMDDEGAPKPTEFLGGQGKHHSFMSLKALEAQNEVNTTPPFQSVEGNSTQLGDLVMVIFSELLDDADQKVAAETAEAHEKAVSEKQGKNEIAQAKAAMEAAAAKENVYLGKVVHISAEAKMVRIHFTDATQHTGVKQVEGVFEDIALTDKVYMISKAEDGNVAQIGCDLKAFIEMDKTIAERKSKGNDETRREKALIKTVENMVRDKNHVTRETISDMLGKVTSEAQLSQSEKSVTVFGQKSKNVELVMGYFATPAGAAKPVRDGEKRDDVDESVTSMLKQILERLGKLENGQALASVRDAMPVAQGMPPPPAPPAQAIPKTGAFWDMPKTGSMCGFHIPEVVRQAREDPDLTKITLAPGNVWNEKSHIVKNAIEMYDCIKKPETGGGDDTSAKEKFMEVAGESIENLVAEITHNPKIDPHKKGRMAGFVEQQMAMYGTDVQVVVIHADEIHSGMTDVEVQKRIHQKALLGDKDKKYVAYPVLLDVHYYLGMLQQGDSLTCVFEVGEESDEALKLILNAIKEASAPKLSLAQLMELDGNARGEAIRAARAQPRKMPIIKVGASTQQSAIPKPMAAPPPPQPVVDGAAWVTANQSGNKGTRKVHFQVSVKDSIPKEKPVSSLVVWTDEKPDVFLSNVSQWDREVANLIHTARPRQKDGKKHLVIMARGSNDQALRASIDNIWEMGYDVKLYHQQSRSGLAQTARQGMERITREAGVCRYFLQREICPFGSTCRFKCHHSNHGGQ